MNKYITDDQLIIIILAGTVVGSFITQNTDLLNLVAGGLMGYLGKTFKERV